MSSAQVMAMCQLLSACRQARDYLDCIQSLETVLPQAKELAGTVQRQVEAAIAKAEFVMSQPQ